MLTNKSLDPISIRMHSVVLSILLIILGVQDGLAQPLGRTEIRDSSAPVLEVRRTRSSFEADIIRFGDDSGYAYLGAGSNYILIGNEERDSVLVISQRNGYVGIGTNRPTSKLHVDGRVRADRFTTDSDARLKINVIQLSNVLEKLQKIRGVSFEWREPVDSPNHSTRHRDIGVLAQEVEAVFPELVTQAGDYKTIDYGRLTSILIEAVKESHAETTAQTLTLETRLAELEKAFGVDGSSDILSLSRFSNSGVLLGLALFFGFVLGLIATYKPSWTKYR